MDQLQHYAAIALPALLVAFMAGNLAAIGLELDFHEALMPLRNRHFIVVVLMWNCLLCPVYVWLLAWAIPMAQPYAIGLQLIGLAPAAPFLPLAVREAGGDLAYSAAFLLLGAASTVLMMPLVLPLIAPGLDIGVWTITKPLLALLLVPLAIGLAARAWAPGFAKSLHHVVKPISHFATLAVLVCIVFVYFDSFIEAVGSFALATQLLFTTGVTIGSYILGAGLKANQRSVVSLGVCTRNLGAAFAPLLETSADPRTTVMVALGVPISLAVTIVAAAGFRMQATRSRQSPRRESPD